MITRTAAILSLTASLVGLSGCSTGPRDTYAQNTGSYLKLPGQWEVFTGEQIVRSQDATAEPPPGVEMTGFALGSDDPGTVLNSTAYPAGVLLNSPIPDGATTEMDRAVVITNLNELLGTGGATLVEPFTSFVPAEGTRGERAVFDVPDLDGDSMRLTQLTVTDDARSRIWVLIVGCDPECHERQRGLLENITTTWKVEPKR